MEEDDINSLWEIGEVDGKEVLYLGVMDFVRPNYLELG